MTALVPRPLTNGAFWPRTLKPTVLLCVHITGNATTAKEPSGTSAPGQGAYDEWHYANRAGSPGPSAHDYLNRDGTGIEALTPATQCAWSNGDVLGPNLSIATVAACVRASVNPNRICWREVECVGYGSTYPVSAAQIDTLAQLVAADAKATGLPIDRTTVTTHADWNSVNRANCAFAPDQREAYLADLIARARAIAGVEIVKGYAVPKAPTLAVVAKGARLYQDTTLSDAQAGNIDLDPGRPLPYFGEVLPAIHAVEYVDTAGVHSGKAWFVKATAITGYQPVAIDAKHKIGVTVDGVLRPSTVTEV